MTVVCQLTAGANPGRFAQWDAPSPSGPFVLQGTYPVAANSTQPAYATLVREIRVIALPVDPVPPPKDPPPPPPAATIDMTVDPANRPVRVETWDNGVLTNTTILPRLTGPAPFQATNTREIRVLELVS